MKMEHEREVRELQGGKGKCEKRSSQWLARWDGVFIWTESSFM